MRDEHAQRRRGARALCPRALCAREAEEEGVPEAQARGEASAHGQAGVLGEALVRAALVPSPVTRRSKRRQDIWP